MRRRGVIFKNFREVPKSDDAVVKALHAVNSNLKLVLEMLADLRVNTSDDPKKAREAEEGGKKDGQTT